MSKQLSQKEYLKKYLSKSDGTKAKKKKKRPKVVGEGLKIVDDDAIGPAEAQCSNQVELDLMLADEDAPQVAEFIDETKAALARTTANWKTVSDGKLNFDDRWGKKSNPDKNLRNENLSPTRLDNTYERKNKYKEVVDDKSPSRRSRIDRSVKDLKYEHNISSDESPPRKSNKVGGTKSSRNTLPDNYRSSSRHDEYKQKYCDSFNDMSPPNKPNLTSNHKSYNKEYRENSIDISPPRRSHSTNHYRNQTNDLSPPRLSDDKIFNNSKNSAYDDLLSHKKIREKSADMSPPRRSHMTNKYYKHDKSLSPTRHSNDRRFSASKKSSNEDLSSHKKSREKSADMSPPRRSHSNNNYRSQSNSSPRHSDARKYSSSKSSFEDSLSRKKYREKSADMSPPRRSQSTNNYHNRSNDVSPPKKYDNRDSRSNYRYERDSQSILKRGYANREYDDNKSKYSRNDDNSDQDFSPPQKVKPSSNMSERNSRKQSSCQDSYQKKHSVSRRDEDDQSPPRAKKMTKTLDGKVAGLQDAKSLRVETEHLRKKEKNMIMEMNDEVSGRYAKTVSRKTGRKEESEDEDEKNARLERERIHKEKYTRWGKGLKQVEEMKAQMQDVMHEMNKPLARYANDEDLDRHLREQIHADDPMLEYIQKKQMEKNVKEGIKIRPEYKGSFPANRFDIKPGYRWDGVDRSNGYEKLWFEKQSAKKANEEEAYKWSTEDM